VKSEVSGPSVDFNLTRWLSLNYYREPALSVLWPIFEKSPDHLTIRPLYAVHGLEAKRPVHTLLWPLGRFDPGQDEYRFFPFFWDDDSFTLFPVYWHSGTPFAGDGLHALWPLWIYSRRPAGSGHRTILNLAWPLLRFERSPWGKSNMFFPLFYAESKSGWSLFVSPLYFSNKGNHKNIQGVPLLLSWRERLPEHDTLRVLWPLSRFSSGKDAQSSYVFPLWSHDPRRGRLLTPFYMKGGDGETRWMAVPPLFYREEGAGESMWVTLLGGMRCREDGGWLVTPFYADWRRGEDERVTTVPPLLSWKMQNGDMNQLYILAGLARINLGPAEGPSHLFPLWFRNPATESFFTPLWAGWKQGTTTHRMIPLLLSAWKTEASGAKHSSYLGGLGGRSLNAAGETQASRLLPFWAQKEGAYFFTPLYGRDEPGKAGSFHYWFSPLVGSYRNQQRGGWLFPLFHRKVENESGHGRTRVLWATRRWNAQGHKTSIFPFWRSKETVYGDNGPRLRENNILWRLYDSRSESGGGDKAHDYVRRRILWRVWHYERLNGDVSVDALPFITYDRKTDGFKRVSFLGRVFRYQKNADGGKSLDLLFIPLRRPAEQKQRAGRFKQSADSDGFDGGLGQR
jgi:hypothetical protein